MSNYYDLFRAGHIICVIFWMAGLLYLPRLFVYHHQAKPSGELETTLMLQEKRLMRIIMLPAMVASVFFGIGLVWIDRDALLMRLWLPAKLFLVVTLLAFHGLLAADRKKFERGERPRSEKFYRITNEVPAILTIFIVGLAVLEPF